jgi:uncharacterized protein YkwD
VAFLAYAYDNLNLKPNQELQINNPQQNTTPPSRLSRSLFTAVIVLGVMITPHAVQAQSSPDTPTAQHYVYLPLIAGEQSAWQLNPQEQQVETLFRNDPEQHRQNPTRNDILSQVARARAEDMAQHAYFSHTSADGHGPNYWVTQAGYNLPAYYTPDGNNIESIGLNYSTADLVWDAWQHSEGHRVHILGEDPFYAAQTDYGIGYAESNSSRYWVVITAEQGQ